MKFYTRVEGFNTIDYAIEGSKLFGSTKWKLGLPPATHIDPTKWTIPSLSMQSFNYAEHGVAHSTSVLHTGYHIYFLMPPNFNCQTMLSNASQYMNFVQCKMQIGKHDISPPTYKETKKKLPSTNNVEHAFWFCLNNIKRCVSGSKEKYVMNQFLKGEGFGSRGLNFSRGRRFCLVVGSQQLGQLPSLVTNFRATKSWRPPYFQNFKI